MPRYAVTKPLGTTDEEFLEYVALLQDLGVDVLLSPRVVEPGTGRRWLYAWNSPGEAETLAEKLRRRTRDPSWSVRPFDNDAVECREVRNLEIRVRRDAEGLTFRLTRASRTSIATLYPTARVWPQLAITYGTYHDYAQQHGSIWPQVVRLLTGLGEHELAAIGGIQIYDPAADEVLYRGGPAGEA